MELLLVEDDESLGYILKEYLEMNGYSIIWAKDGEEGFQQFGKYEFDLCLLDVMLPLKDGFSLAKDIRAINTHVPIVFLTSRALKVDKLKGFNLGADDYIVKPVDEEELIARIQAIIKRSSMSNGHSDSSFPAKFEIGAYTFDYSNQRLIHPEGHQTLTHKEAEIFKRLCINIGQITDRKTTLRDVWGESDYFNRRSMDVYISRLRKYLDKDSRIRILNVHGRGFILEVTDFPEN